MIAGVLHTVPALAGAFDELLAESIPGAYREHIVDAWLLETAIADGVTADVRARVASHLAHLADAGADAVLVTCSSIGEAAERAAEGMRIPVVRVDAAMAAEAVRLAGSGARVSGPPVTAAPMIAALATNTATLGPTSRLIEREAAAQGSGAVVTARVVAGAAAARAEGDRATHDRLIAEAVRAVAGEATVVVLAQASMADAAAAAGVDVPVLTSPAGGVARLREALTPSGPDGPVASANRPAASGPDGTSGVRP
ncbi:aspartate/glutamate racemase family protein [Leifsonia sp. NPDC080035]|uniref:Aspartate/glutamate racemase family protein n=1 Tax=Leifsonia sp. NPDC080035 TaxID=3143936 RepID=A0AAU7GHA4_9MICO